MRFNVPGCYNATTKDLPATARVGRLDAAYIIDTLDAWAATRSRPTALVPDNARIPHAAASQARLAAWKDQACTLFTCSPKAPPHQNQNPLAQDKNEWRHPEAYADSRTLRTAVWYILDRASLKYTIQFAP